MIAAIVAMAAMTAAMIFTTYLAEPGNVPLPGAEAREDECQDRPGLAVSEREVAAERQEVVTGSAGSPSFQSSSAGLDAVLCFRGAVHSSSGDPIAGAHIRIGKEPSARDEWPEAIARADGAFTLALPVAVAAHGSPFSLFAVAPGFASSLQQGLQAPAIGVVDLGTVVLLRPASITGQVLGAGFPLPDAIVDATVASVAAAKTAPRLHVSAKTDAAGAFQLREVPPGMLRITVAADGHVGSTIERLVREEEQVEDVVFRLAAGAPIEGTVFDANGSDVAGVTIDYESTDATWFSTTTAASGEFTVGPVPPRSKGRIWAKTATATFGPVAAQAGQRGIRIDLSPRYSVAGRVLDARTGLPLPGTSVQLVTSRATDAAAQPEADVEQIGQASACDERGAFRLSARHRGWYAVVAHGQDVAPVMSRWVWLSPDGSRNATGVDLMLHPGCRVSGKVVDSEGAPIPEAIVSLGDEAGALTPKKTTTDGAGAFVFTDVRPDRHVLTAEARAFVATKVAVEVQDRTDRTDVAIVLARAAEIRGRVVAESPQARWQWVVRVAGAQQVSGAQQQWQGVANRDGRFTVVAVAPGTHSIWAEAVVPGEGARPADDGSADKPAEGGPLGATEPVPITVAEGSVVEVEIVATHCEPARIYGFVTGAGDPISNAELVAVSAGGGMLGASQNRGRLARTRTSGDGSYEIWTASGSVDLEMRPGAAPPMRRQLILTPGSAVAASFALGAASVAGRIVDMSRWPIQGALVRLVQQQSSSGRVAVTAESEGDGSFLFRLLEPGSYVLMRGRMGAATTATGFSLEAGEVKNLGDLVEEIPVPVEVQVWVPSAASAGTCEPLAEGRVVVESLDGHMLPRPWKGGTFAKDELKVREGLLKIEHLTPGHYQLRLRRPITATWPLQITLAGPHHFDWNVGQEPPKPRSPN